jgi:hypothetical protein
MAQITDLNVTAVANNRLSAFTHLWIAYSEDTHRNATLGGSPRSRSASHWKRGVGRS